MERAGRIWSRLEASYGLDLRSLAAFRIACGSVLVLDLAMRARQLRMFYTDDGAISAWFFTQQLAKTLPWPHYWNGSLAFQSALFVLAALFAIAMLVGYRTRTATLLSWIMLCSLQFRNGAILTWGDTIWRLIMFFAVFLPLGARWSLDALARRGDGPVYPGARLLSVGVIAFQVQIFLIYFFAAVHKTGSAWADGSAVYYALAVDYYATAVGTWMLQFPTLLQWLTYGTLAFEFGAPWLLLSPFYSPQVRLAAALIILGFHLGLVSTMRFGVFHLIPGSILMVFIPTFVWDWIRQRRGAE